MDLSLVPMEDLWNAMKERYPHAVLVTDKEPDEETREICVRFAGDLILCLGLLAVARRRIERDWEAAAEDQDDEE